MRAQKVLMFFVALQRYHFSLLELMKLLWVQRLKLFMDMSWHTMGLLQTLLIYLIDCINVNPIAIFRFLEQQLVIPNAFYIMIANFHEFIKSKI